MVYYRRQHNLISFLPPALSFLPPTSDQGVIPIWWRCAVPYIIRFLICRPSSIHLNFRRTHSWENRPDTPIIFRLILVVLIRIVQPTSGSNFQVIQVRNPDYREFEPGGYWSRLNHRPLQLRLRRWFSCLSWPWLQKRSWLWVWHSHWHGRPRACHSPVNVNTVRWGSSLTGSLAQFEFSLVSLSCVLQI